jgi:hypothetical protein
MSIAQILCPVLRIARVFLPMNTVKNMSAAGNIMSPLSLPKL